MNQDREANQDMEGRDQIVAIENGEKAWSPFSPAEMTRRQDAVRSWMAENRVDATLFTSYHNIAYHSGWLYCGFGRRYGMTITDKAATTLSAGVDAGQPWRRSFGDNLTYHDWRRDNYLRAVGRLIGRARRVAIEEDHVSISLRRALGEAFPDVEFVDVAEAAMWMRAVKSAEEIALIRIGARIADLGGAACVQAIAPGVAEYEAAAAGVAVLNREIAASFPFVELMDSWVWLQSGIHTDGAHNPLTNRRIAKGDILSLNVFPMMFGYYAALERTLFCGPPSDIQMDMWRKNTAVHRRGLELMRPGARCCDIAAELNAMYREWGVLKYRSFGYGHSFGVLCHYYGREAGVELREDVETELRPGMVVSMEPMLSIPEDEPGAGGYREHDILVIGENGAENLTGYPIGPESNVIGA